MLEVFARKLEDYGKFSPEDQKKLLDAHEKILKSQVIPAYQLLIQGLESLRGTGVSSRGLAHFSGGKEYYEYLLKSQVGSYASVADIEKRLLSQLSADFKAMQLLLRKNSALIEKLQQNPEIFSTDPEQILQRLNQCITEDFPEPPSAPYEVLYVHESMEDYLSPAFYLTPPLDTGTPNVIYINRSGRHSGPELVSTLAHEGFPGHLYQTTSFASCQPEDIRYLISCGGYVEGWATYVESCLPSYADNFIKDSDAKNLSSLYWLNRSINLCIYSLLDIGIHEHGWNQSQTARFLRVFGIQKTDIIQEIYQYIVETPANYLKYYWGYLNFLDLREMQKKELGEDFDLRLFHQKVLEIGPVPFPVLYKYMTQ